MRADVVFVSENASWIIRDICEQVQATLEKARVCTVGITYSPLFLRNTIIHFGSIGTLVRNGRVRQIHKSNTVILTWFHIEPDDKRLVHISTLNTIVSLVHTASQQTKAELIAHGFAPKKIVVIPLGIDLQAFHTASTKEKQIQRKSLDIPDSTVVIGSFQKDGHGWGDGNEPKLIKGPDIFCDVVERLAADHKTHVLLTGPARGYVKGRLDAAGIPYTHTYLKTYRDIDSYYAALDLYIVASRVEGGPMAVLEAWATGVPLVSTRVGMIADIVEDGVDGLLADVEDVDALTAHAGRIINDTELQKKLSQHGSEHVIQYGWQHIAGLYYKKLYNPFILAHKK